MSQSGVRACHEAWAPPRASCIFELMHPVVSRGHLTRRVPAATRTYPFLTGNPWRRIRACIVSIMFRIIGAQCGAESGLCLPRYRSCRVNYINGRFSSGLLHPMQKRIPGSGAPDAERLFQAMPLLRGGVVLRRKLFRQEHQARDDGGARPAPGVAGDGGRRAAQGEGRAESAQVVLRRRMRMRTRCVPAYIMSPNSRPAVPARARTRRHWR